MSSVGSSLALSAAPVKPVITLKVDSRTVGDLITNDGALNIAPLADPANQTRVVKLVNIVDGTTTDLGAVYVPPTESGKYQVIVIDTNTATNEASEPASLTFTLDLDKPEPPTLQLANDTSSGLNITSEGIVVAISAELAVAGTTVQYFISSAPSGVATGIFDTLPAFTVEGTYSIYAKLVDAAGNASSLSEEFAFTLDKTPPAAPAVTLTFDAEDGAVDGITAKDGFNVTGNGPDDSIEYSLDGTTWTATAPDKLANGDYTIHVRLRDTAGNASPETTLDFKIRKTVPDGPDNPQITNDSGADATDGITNVIPVITTDTLPTGATLQFQVKGTTTWVDSLAASNFTGDGAYTIVVRLVGANGIPSTVTDEVSFTLDTTVDVLTATLTNGTTANGTTTVDKAPTFDFDADETGAVVRFSTDDGATWQTTDKLSTLTAGDYTMLFQQTDIAGNVSDASEAVTFSITSTTPIDDPRFDVGGIGSGNDGAGAGLSGADFGW